MSASTNPLTIFLEMAWSSFLFDFNRYIIAALIAVAIVSLMARTRFASRKIQARVATGADIRREFLQSVRSCFVYTGVTVVIVWAINMGFINKVGDSLGWTRDLLLLAGIILAHDAYFYWVHRALHTPLLYKRFHLAHHRSTTPTPFAAYSFSISEATLMGLFVILWQLFVPTPGWVMFTFLAFQIMINALGHSGYEMRPRWWLSNPVTRLLNTTTHHDLHHAGSFHHNYGLYFTFWDKLMGTEHPRYVETFARVTAATTPRTAHSATVPHLHSPEPELAPSPTC